MAASADAIYVAKEPDGYSVQIVNSARPYVGALQVIGHADHGTAANVGRLFPYSAAANQIPSGWAINESQAGNTGASPIPEQQVDLRARIRTVNVTGTTAVTDAGRQVYASDDNTYTLTRPTLGIPVGRVWRWRSGTECEVYFYSVEVLDAIALGGLGQGVWQFAIHGNVAAAGDLIAGFEAPFHGRFLNFYAFVMDPLAGGGATMAINFEIGGTNLTGGVITWAGTDARGSKLADTAITATTAEFHEGDLIDIEAASVTAGTGGLLLLCAEYEKLLGL